MICCGGKYFFPYLTVFLLSSPWSGSSILCISRPILVWFVEGQHALVNASRLPSCISSVPLRLIPLLYNSSLYHCCCEVLGLYVQTSAISYLVRQWDCYYCDQVRLHYQCLHATLLVIIVVSFLFHDFELRARHLPGKHGSDILTDDRSCPTAFTRYFKSIFSDHDSCIAEDDLFYALIFEDPGLDKSLPSRCNTPSKIGLYVKEVILEVPAAKNL